MTVIILMDTYFCPADRRAQFERLEYTEEDYQKELEHIEEVRLFNNSYDFIVMFIKIDIISD